MTGPTRCTVCWYGAELCVCNRPDDRPECLDAYLQWWAQQGQRLPQHPSIVAKARRWVRLVGLERTGDPATYERSPFGVPLQVAFETEDTTAAQAPPVKDAVWQEPSNR